MQVRVQVVIEYEDESQETITEEISVLTRQAATEEIVGLTLDEGKQVLAALQKQMVSHQVATLMQAYKQCQQCDLPHRRNGHQHLTYRTLFGNIKLRGQRYYQCKCQGSGRRTFSPVTKLIPERTAPEYSFLQAKWSSLMSYGLTVKLLEDVLPLNANVATTFRNTHATAQRIEAELGDEQPSYIVGNHLQWAELPDPEERMFVGIDGGYVRGRTEAERKAGHFEIIVGKSLFSGRDHKRFAFVQTYDEKPRRRVFETLKAQGMQMNQEVTFLSDGADDVRDVQYYLNPDGDHILDWFHVTMKLTSMRQIAKGISSETTKVEALAALERIKWRLWYGHVRPSLDAIEELKKLCMNGEEEGVDPQRDKLASAIAAYETYIKNNAKFIPNYAERHRYGEIIATGFVESTVNEIVSKRMVKKQQMRWTRKGAHLLLQVRVKTLNNELRDKFEGWYPALMSQSSAHSELPLCG